jgi:hypothetical protein
MDYFPDAARAALRQSPGIAGISNAKRAIFGPLKNKQRFIKEL